MYFMILSGNLDVLSRLSVGSMDMGDKLKKSPCILMYDWECVPHYISNLICRKQKSNRNSIFWNMINCSDQYFKIIIFEFIRKWTKKIECLLYSRKWRFFSQYQRNPPRYMCHTIICWNSRLRWLRVGCGTYESPGI